MVRSSMSVPVMEVRIVRMGMHHRFVTVPMTVRFAQRVVRKMDVLMVLIMGVQVFVLQRLVPVHVLVAFGQV